MPNPRNLLAEATAIVEGTASLKPTVEHLAAALAEIKKLREWQFWAEPALDRYDRRFIEQKMGAVQ